MTAKVIQKRRWWLLGASANVSTSGARSWSLFSMLGSDLWMEGRHHHLPQ